MKFTRRRSNTPLLRFIAVLSVVAALWFNAIPQRAHAQVVATTPEPVSETTAKENEGFRVEKVTVEGGSELITIFARRSFKDGPMQGPVTDIPLVSVLRDTLGDEKPENDRLRYV